MGQLLIVSRMNAAVSTSLPRWVTKEVLMLGQCGFPLLVIGGITVQDSVLGNEAAFDLTQPDFGHTRLAC